MRNRESVKVVAVERNLIGSINKYLLSNGKIATRKQMVDLVESGWIPGYDIAIDKYGGKSVRASKDSKLSRLSTLSDIQIYYLKKRMAH